MKKFMDEEFLLETGSASELYHGFAEDMPIADFHCHLSPKEIAEDKKWEDMSELWLGGDHYKWRAMRSDGIDERYITGDAAPKEKFRKYAELMPRLIGNPLYHWTHLELKRYFGVDEPLSGGSCDRIWEKCSEKLKDMSARGIIKSSNVRLIYTTDDPADELRYHELLKKESVKVLPAWRPDRAMNIDRDGFAGYVAGLGGDIRDIDALKSELVRRMDRFGALGCLNSDHGLDFVPHRFDGAEDAAFKKALRGEKPDAEETESYKTAMLLFLAGEYRRRGWVMQLHFGAVRNTNPIMFARLGPDTGFDAISGSAGCGEALAALLGKIEAECGLPKTVLYSLDPADNAQIDSIIGCFQSPEARGKLQHGSAWWFNDTKKGMEEQIKSLASMSVLANFIGMVTDSRSFLSYTRHEYFRRVLCSVLGDWMERGEYPADMDAAGAIVRDICFNNAIKYFEAEDSCV
ncbi:MAG: glucuronate isomerase [Oscillospiraceae bacterium]|nr:glucuronate isomerase [Oscillospiraceae bacterium]